MRIVVTGGAGFIGSHVTDRLLQEGHHVVVFDNLSTGKKERVHPHADFLQLDIRSPEFQTALIKIKPDAVFHFAAQISVQKSLRNPIEDAQINIEGTLNVLEGCRNSGAGKLIYSSSAAVYGDPAYLPVDERHSLNPSSCYGLSKLVPESYIQLYSNLYGLNYSILRYSNVFGVRQEAGGDGGVIPIFLHRLLNNETPLIHGDGSQTRDFIYVKDVSDANYACLYKGDRQILNIGSGRAVSVSQLLQIMIELTGKDSAVLHGPPRKGDIAHSVLSNQTAFQSLEWTPHYTLEEGLRETILYLLTKATK